MADAIVYCDRCFRIIVPSEISDELAIVTATAAVCASCASSLAPEERAALLSPAGGAAGVRQSRVSTAAAREGSARAVRQAHDAPGASTAGPRTRTALVVFGVGALAGLAATALITMSPKGPPAAQPSGTPARGLPTMSTSSVTGDAGRPVETPEAGPTAARSGPRRCPDDAARRRLQRIRAEIEPSLGRYEEIRKGLVALTEDLRGIPEAEEARRVLAEVDAQYAELAESALGAASDAAEAFAASGRYDQATGAIRSVGARFSQGDWLESRGRGLIDEALKKIEESRASAARSALARARDALAQDEFAAACDVLTAHASWPEEERSRAEALLKDINEREAEAARERRRAKAWKEFLVEVLEAGRKGAAEAEDLLKRERPRLEELGLRDELVRVAERIREARLVDSLAADSFRDTRGLVRVHWRQRPVSGKVVKIADGVLTLKPPVGAPVEVPLSEIRPTSIVEAAGLLRPQTGDPIKAAGYCLVRGDIEAAHRLAADLMGEEADALRGDITAAAAALAPPEVAGDPDGAPDEAARAPSSRQSRPPDPSLVGHWKLDEGIGTTAADSSAGGNAGRLIDMDPTTCWVVGKIRGALRFDGSNKVDVPHSADLNPGRFSFALWVKPTGGSGYRSPLTSRGNRPQRGYKLYATPKDVWSFWVGTGSDYAGLNGPAVTYGEWQHIACTYDGSTMKMYVNGGHVASRRAGFSPNTADPLRIGAGATEGAGDFYFTGLIDEVRVYNRALGADEIEALHLEPELVRSSLNLRTPADGIGRPERDGYFLSWGVLLGLSKSYDKAKLTPKRLAAVGGAAAASASFDRSLKKELGAGDGYTFARNLGLAKRGMTHAAARKGLERGLERGRPEVVRICFDAADLARGRSATDLRPDLAHIVEKVLERGAVPVLFTLPVPTPPDKRARRLIEGYNKTVLELAAGMKVPCVDAFSILGRDPAALDEYFSHRGALKAAGFRAVNDAFLRLYRTVERAVMGREVSVPGPAAAKAAGPVREAGGLLANGGFEEESGRTRFAANWTPYCWGAERVQYSVRLDRTSPRTGERALVVRAFGDGARPGAFTKVTLAPGRYEVVYWACASADETAEVQAHIAGRDLAVGTVGDEWKEFRETVEITERQVGASLKLWTATPRVRVWFDDAEVRAVR